MKLLISAIGRAKQGPERTLFETYTKRLPWSLDLREIDDRKTANLPDGKDREAQALLETVPNGAFVITLDEKGKDLTSVELAKRLSDWTTQGYNPISFLIGGARGHGEAVRKRADFNLSIGKMTWPHMLVRAMLAEQLYRAWSIDTGHPYHRV
ncbi:MAG: 23S rRNA (pseudouridine(1915)-N(3))-methyltransferase RlmH [Alphaproteobacteria bacterium]|nr:MAG: 23S rRNA (pseudouridine(1915)-N(3))-methyltransferase RlmH [Alphaproteobacteria bacterium]